jgi:cAMP phosphodiesterase
MRLRVLGCSGGFGFGLRTSAFLVDDDVLIDAGTGVGDLTYDEMRCIDHVFVTHSHLDHVASIPLLVDTLLGERHEPLVVHAQQTTIDALRAHLFNGQIWPDFTTLPSLEAPALRFEAIEPGEVARVGQRRFEAIEVNHAVAAVAFRCAGETGSFCFSGDTSTNDTLWPALNAAGPLDWLIVELGFPNRESELADLAKHYCPTLLARDLAKLDACPPIAVTHLKAGSEAETMAELEAALPQYRLLRLQGGESFQL